MVGKAGVEPAYSRLIVVKRVAVIVLCRTAFVNPLYHQRTSLYLQGTLQFLFRKNFQLFAVSPLRLSFLNSSVYFNELCITYNTIFNLQIKPKLFLIFFYQSFKYLFNPFIPLLCIAPINEGFFQFVHNEFSELLHNKLHRTN